MAQGEYIQGARVRGLTEAGLAAVPRLSGLEEGKMGELEIKMAELATAGKETETRLNAFIVFVEKYISSRNGES